MNLPELEPLIEPAPISAWPLAPGWWLVLLAVLVVAIALGFWSKRPKTKARAPQPSLDPIRLEAVHELKSLAKPYQSHSAALWLQQLNSLLKRLCRLSYPDAASHTLTGRAWLAFLDNRCPAAGLTRWMILVEGAYKGQCQMSDKAIDELEHAVDVWIRKHV